MQTPLTLVVLIALNLALQLFDGIATYVGWQHFGEANPLLRTGFDLWGAGPTLVVAKGAAAILILMLGCAGRPVLVSIGLSFTLVAYTALSLIPWSLATLAVAPRVRRLSGGARRSSAPPCGRPPRA